MPITMDRVAVTLKAPPPMAEIVAPGSMTKSLSARKVRLLAEFQVMLAAPSMVMFPMSFPLTEAVVTMRFAVARKLAMSPA